MHPVELWWCIVNCNIWKKKKKNNNNNNNNELNSLAGFNLNLQHLAQVCVLLNQSLQKQLKEWMNAQFETTGQKKIVGGGVAGVGCYCISQHNETSGAEQFEGGWTGSEQQQRGKWWSVWNKFPLVDGMQDFRVVAACMWTVTILELKPLFWCSYCKEALMGI